MSMPNRCLRGHFVGDTACRVCEPDRSDYVLGVRRVPELDAQLDRDLQAIREAERSVDLNVRIGEPWTGWTMEADDEKRAELISSTLTTYGLPTTPAEVLEDMRQLRCADLGGYEPVSVRPRHRRPVKRWWKRR
jgi:hypothetical protein